MYKIGVLGLQGAVSEHVDSVKKCGCEAVIVKTKEQLNDIDGLIIPGGESTTIRKLMDRYGLIEPIRNFGLNGKPIFGTCAGLIILAKKIVSYDSCHLGLMDVTVERNSFGRQRESFETPISIKGVGESFPAVFIRAPHIVSVGEKTEILAMYQDRIVAARDNNYLGCSFHPELTEDLRLTKYFINMIEDSKK